MTRLMVTRHAETRSNQRGFRKSDLYVILFFGTEIGRNRIMLTKRDAAREIKNLKKPARKTGRGQTENVANGIDTLRPKIADFERCLGKVIVFVDGKCVTMYHQTGRIKTERQRRG